MVEVIEPPCLQVFEGKAGFYEIGFRGRIYENRAMPVIHEDGSIEEGIVITQEITSRKKTEFQADMEKSLVRALSETADLAEALNICLDIAIEASGADCGGIYLLEEETMEYVLALATGVPEVFQKISGKIPKGTAQFDIIQKGSSVHARYPDLHLSSHPEIQKEGLKAFSTIPIKHKSRVIGCMNIASHTREQFTEIEQKGMENIAARFGDAYIRFLDEKALRESNQRLHLALTSAKMGIWDWYIESGKVVWFGEHAALFGIGAEEFKGTIEAVQKAIHPEDREKGMLVFRKVVEEGAVFENTYRVIWPDGSKHWLYSYGNLVRDDQGNPWRIMGTTRDITAYKLQEDERRKLEDQLRQAQKMEAIGTLAGGIAHDFNNILFPIIGYAELGISRQSRDCRCRENFGEILKAAQRAKELVRQILTFSRKYERKLENVSVTPIVKEALKLIRSAIPTTIAIHQEIRETGNVMADLTEIHQVVMNLCTNAYQSMAQKGGTLTISLYEEAADPEGHEEGTDRYVVLSVSDTGCGMEDNIRQKIFEPYYTTKTKDEGTGLGLAVVDGIVRSHGGFIRVKSRAGKGSTFTVFIPLIRKALPCCENTEDTPLPTGKERIMIVDDDIQIVNMMEKMLVSLGYSVTKTCGSVDALSRFKEQPGRFDLIISDMAMPDMSGDFLCERIREIRNDIPVILITGYTDKIAPGRYREKGFSEFLAKPVSRTELAGKVRKVLDDSGVNTC